MSAFDPPPPESESSRARLLAEAAAHAARIAEQLNPTTLPRPTDGPDPSREAPLR